MQSNTRNDAKLPADFDRRAFFTKIGLGSLGIAAAGTIVFSYDFCRQTFCTSHPQSSTPASLRASR